MRPWICAAALSLLAGAVSAAEIGGVKFEDKTRVGTQELSLNGGGVRTRAFFKVYSMGLYVAEKKTAADALLAGAGAKRVHIVTLRDLSAQQFADALIEGMQKNNPEPEIAKLQPKIDEFKGTLLALKEAPKGTTIFMDFLPEAGTRLTVNGQGRGKDIAGEEFYRALLRIWLGANPVQPDLKDALLGKAG
jgi:hypothetical protein